MWAIMVVLQLMLPRDSLSSIVSLLSLKCRWFNLLKRLPEEALPWMHKQISNGNTLIFSNRDDCL